MNVDAKILKKKKNHVQVGFVPKIVVLKLGCTLESLVGAFKCTLHYISGGRRQASVFKKAEGFKIK